MSKIMKSSPLLTQVREEFRKKFTIPDPEKRSGNILRHIKDNFLIELWLAQVIEKAERETREKAFETVRDCAKSQSCSICMEALAKK